VETEGTPLEGALIWHKWMDDRGLFVSDYEDDVEGDIFDAIIEALSQILHGLPPGGARDDVDQALDNLMNQWDLIIVLKFGNEIAVYSRNPAPSLPNEFIKQLRNFIGANEDTPVVVFQSVGDNDPKMSTAAYVFFGKKDEQEPEDGWDLNTTERSGYKPKPGDLEKLGY